MSASQPCKCQLPSPASQGIEPHGICPLCGGLRTGAAKRVTQIGADLLPAPATRRSHDLGEADLALLRLNLQRTSRGGNSETASTKLEGASRPVGERLNRRTNHLWEQRKLCRMLGIAVVLWALFSLLPAGVGWQRWLGHPANEPLPLWIPMFAAFGSTPLFLGALLLLVSDWTTLKSAASGLLAVASGYAFAGSLFALARPDRRWLGALQFPFTETGAATLWCLSMMILAGVLSLLCFLEGQRWRRIEQLFDEIQLQRSSSKSVSGSRPA